jgi:hypothetical protein
MQRYDKPTVYDNTVGTHNKAVWADNGKLFSRSSTGIVEVQPNGRGGFDAVPDTWQRQPHKPVVDKSAARAAMIERCRRMNGTR